MSLVELQIWYRDGRERNGWVTRKGTPAQNRDFWELLLREARTYLLFGIDVQIWRTPREWNTEADAAAKQGANQPQKQVFARDVSQGKQMSLLLRLPTELRLKIYIALFESIRLAFGERSTSRIGRKVIKPKPNALSLLYTCRLIRGEISDLWLNYITFSFESPKELLDKLSPLPHSKSSNIRYVRVEGGPLVLSPIGYDDDIFYRTVAAFKLLPMLCLDRLTVLEGKYGVVAYDTLDGLIRFGNRLKELHFITPNSTMLSFAREEIFVGDPYWRKPQPSTWRDVMCERDGVSTQPSVEIYRATVAKTQGAIFIRPTRQVFTQEIPKSEPEAFGIEKDSMLSKPEEEGKELLVVVKRGHHVNIMERDGPPFPVWDVREWAHGLSWGEIQGLQYHPEDDSDEDSLASMLGYGDPVEIDHYQHVDDYEWPVID